MLLVTGTNKVYSGVTVWYIDSNNDVWGAGSYSGQLVKTLSNVKEIVFTNCTANSANRQTLMLTYDGTVYSVGTVAQYSGSSIKSPVVGLISTSSPFSTAAQKSVYAYTAINLSSYANNGNIGKVSHLYTSTNYSTQSNIPYYTAYDVYAYTEDQSAKYILKIDQAPYLADLDEADTQILAELNGTATATATATTTADTIPTGTFTDTEGNTFNYADAKQVYGDYILMNNGTLFKYNSTKVAYENITRKYLTINSYSRRFELLKDSKYNN